MTAPSRFRPATRMHAAAHSTGMCRYCLREMWIGDGRPAHMTRGAGLDLDYCESCASWMELHPGEDPRTGRGTKAERIPAERPERDVSWRVDDRACAGLPPELFYPDPEPGDVEFVGPGRERAEVLRLRVRVAEAVCAACPVLERCRATAMEQGYEGLWGGVFFQTETWLDLLTRERGYTIHAVPSRQRAKGISKAPAA